MYCTCHGGEASGRDVFGLQRVLAAGRKPATPPGASRPVSRHRTGHRRITFGKPAGALPSRGEFLVRGAWVLTMDPALGDFPDGDLHVRDGVIVAVGRNLDAPGVAVIDARDMIAMPGFIDTHWHLWNSALRSLVRADDPKEGYFPVTLRLGPLCTPEDAYCSVRLGLAEALASGITTVHDWSHNVRTPQHAEAELRALRETGVRGRFSYGWGQDLPLDKLMNLADLARLRTEWPVGEQMLSLGAALRTPVANPRGVVPIEVLKSEYESIRALGLPITMHARPGVVSLLDQHGLLGRDVQLVHPQGVTPEERVRLAATHTRFSCSPVIEMHYAQAARGEIQFQELFEAGVQQSLSIDSSAASANADFFSCMRALLWSHKQRFGAKVPLPPRRLLELATLEGARDLGLDAQTGSLTPGKRADLILVRTTDLNMAPMIDPVFALVYSAQPSNIDTVIVDGRVLRRGGEFIALDPRQVVREASESVRLLRMRAAV